MKIEFLEAAEVELDEAFKWYETRKVYGCRVDSPIGNPPFRSVDAASGMAVCLSAKPPYGYAIIPLDIFRYAGIFYAELPTQLRGWRLLLFYRQLTRTQ